MSDDRRRGFNILKTSNIRLSLILILLLGAFLLIRFFLGCQELGFYGLAWSPGTQIAYKRVDYFCSIPFTCSFPTNLYAMDKSGREVEIKSGLRGAVDLTWSPDGHHVAFTAGYSFDAGQSSTCFAAVFDIEGGSLRCLSLNDPVFTPTWSPNGAHIAFWSSDAALNIMDIKGGNVIKVPSITGTVYDSLSWSPDSASIAFVSDRDGNYEIYTVQSDDPYIINRMTNHPSSDWAPEWSPDGTRLLFLSMRGGYMGSPTLEGNCGEPSGCGYPKTYTMKSDGTDIKRLIDFPALDWYAKWSPDSTRIVLVSERDGNPEIYVVNPDGTDLVRLTENQFEDSSPVWSPDGSRIAFTSKRNGYLNIYGINADGTNEAQLTRNPSNPQCFRLP
jgi:Tol biopolymer transport system component